MVIECICVASPKPTVTWSHEGKLLKEDIKHKFKVIENGDNRYVFCMDLQVLIEFSLINYKL